MPLESARRIAPAIVLLALAACAGGPGGETAIRSSETPCLDPRPEACTMEYLPVCARLGSGEARTYPNACGACADPAVEAHSPGVCE